MQKGDIVLVSFTGKESGSKMVFDTTDEKIAKQIGIFRENHVFKPIPIVIGNGELILGLEEGLLQMKEGEEKKLEIPHQKAFGERRKELVAVVPLQPVPAFQVGDLFYIQNLVAALQAPSGPTPTPVPATKMQLLQNWLTATFDQNGDGKVNSLDFAELLP
jgi:FKBP-type peptidyl-prolyl cis-trans isomerase 2